MKSPKVAEPFKVLKKITSYFNTRGETRSRYYVGNHTRICYVVTCWKQTREIWQTSFDKEGYQGEIVETWNTAARRKGNLHVQIDECSNASVFKRKAEKRLTNAEKNNK